MKKLHNLGTSCFSRINGLNTLQQLVFSIIEKSILIMVKLIIN